MAKRIFYPAMITRIEGDRVQALVQVGKVEMTLPFPRQVLAYHNLVEKGDRFRFYQNERQNYGIININDIELVERARDPVNLPSNWLSSITNPEPEELK